MKNLCSRILLAGLVLTIVSGCSRSSTPPSAKLHIYTWSEYLPKSVIDEFTKRTGIAVSVDTYASNEELETKLGSGVVDYDIIMPSDYIIQPLIKQKLVRELDKSRLTNLPNLDGHFLDQRFDPGNGYSIPYLWGTTGFAYNKKKVVPAVDSWDALFDPRYKGQVLMLADMRECFAVALKKLGKSINETDPAVLKQAADLLKQQHSLVRAYDSDNYDNKLASGDVNIAHGWNGQMAKVVASKPDDFAYVLPKEGGTIWLDNVCIPTSAKNVDAAYLFMNYILEPRANANIVNGVNYASANVAAKQFIDSKILNDKNIYPTPDMLKGWEFLDDVGGKTMQSLTEMWTEIKAQ